MAKTFKTFVIVGIIILLLVLMWRSIFKVTPEEIKNFENTKIEKPIYVPVPCMNDEGITIDCKG